MQKVLLFFLFFLLSGCSLNTLFLSGEVDKVYVVRNSTYEKEHRAYFSRDHLKPIRHGKKYVYLYNKKKKDMAILLHTKKRYKLYSLSHPEKKEAVFTKKYNSVIRYLKRKGYRYVTPQKAGYLITVSRRRYKGVKTILVDMKDYSHLMELYQKAIRTYSASEIKSIHTKLPKILIYDYYKKYLRKANTPAQNKQLQIIAQKLGLGMKSAQKTQKPEEQTVDNEDEKLSTETMTEEKNGTTIIQTAKVAKPYSYYLHDAPYEELNSYISSGNAQKELTYNQYRNLKEKFYGEKLLREGSLEELIAAYKKNKDPRFKSKIMLLMKQAQSKE